jgi:uncharacterized protein (TIRG00374 family)
MLAGAVARGSTRSCDRSEFTRRTWYTTRPASAGARTLARASMTDAPLATSPPPPSHPARQAALWALKVIVSGGLLYLLFSRVDVGRLWLTARTASIGWLALALLLYLVVQLVSSWRWWLLVHAQHIRGTFHSLFGSYLVAQFFNNFLPSNIGGDVVRIRDTVKAAGSKTLAAMVVIVDRGIGLLGLIFVAAVGSTIAAQMSDRIGPVGPGILWGLLVAAVAVAVPAVMLPQGVGTLLRPLRALHQEWVEERINRLIGGLARFRDAPRTLLVCFGGAIIVQAILVGFYWAIAVALHFHVPLAHLAIVVPMSFIVQMLPVSVNGLGVRETTFVVYLMPLGVPREAALALSLTSAVLIMLFSTSGAIVYLTRRR